MRLCVLLPVMLLIASMQSSLLAQSSDCTGEAAQAQLSSIDPVYVDAMDLARNLVDHGFIVKCVQASKWGNLFVDQQGAALYWTDQGGFDVLFLPKAETFDAVQLVEQRQGSLYLYSLRGTPHLQSDPLGRCHEQKCAPQSCSLPREGSLEISAEPIPPFASRAPDPVSRGKPPLFRAAQRVYQHRPNTVARHAPAQLLRPTRLDAHTAFAPC